MKRVYLSLVLLLLTGMVSAQDSVWVAEETGKLSGIFGSFVMATGDFGDDEGEGAGAAKNGFGGGLMFYSPLAHSPNMSMGFEARLTLNPIDISPLEDFYEDVEFDAGNYTNVWLLGGIKLDASSAISVRGMAGVVLAGFPEIEGDDGYDKVTLSADTEATFGYGFGGTIRLSRALFVDVTYLACKPEFEMESSSSSSTVKVEQEESMVAISLGIAF